MERIQVIINDRIKASIREMDFSQMNAAFVESQKKNGSIVVDSSNSLIDFAMEELDPDDRYRESAVLSIVAFLLRNQISPNGTQDGSCTPLLKAVHRGNYTLAMLLLSAGADPNAVDDEGYTVLISCLDGETPMKSSVLERHEMLELLLVCGATQVLSRSGGEKGRSPISLARLHKNELAVKVLLAYGAAE